MVCRLLGEEDEAGWDLGLSNDLSPTLRRVYERRTFWDQTRSSADSLGWDDGDEGGRTGESIAIFGAGDVFGDDVNVLDVFVKTSDNLSTFSLLLSDGA